MSVNSENFSEIFSKLFWKKKQKLFCQYLITPIYRLKLGDYEISNAIAKTYYEFQETENGKS